MPFGVRAQLKEVRGAGVSDPDSDQGKTEEAQGTQD